MIDAKAFKEDFPIFQKYPQLVYLDNAATTHKPISVIEGICDFYANDYATTNRGLYHLGYQATQKVEACRNMVASFLNTKSSSIVFTKGCTEGINLVASSFLAPLLDEGDNVLISAASHHANLIPWQQLCIQKGATLRIIPISETGELNTSDLSTFIDNRTKLVAIEHISNVLGTVNPIESIAKICRQKSVPLLVDAAQSAGFYELDTKKLSCDFLVFSAHKIFGPTGIGVLYIGGDHIDNMIPYQVGGDMVRDVHYHETTFANGVQKFEAGTNNIAGIIGLKSSIEYLQSMNRASIRLYLKELRELLEEQLLRIGNIRILGTANEKGAITSFVMDGIHAHDIATFLDQNQISIRAGHHCAQPLIDHFDVGATARISLAHYNSEDDVFKVISALKALKKVFL